MQRVIKIICIDVVTLCFMLSSVFNSYATSNNVVFNSNAEHEKKIALTFDDGPHPRNTAKILDILDKYNIKVYNIHII